MDAGAESAEQLREQNRELQQRQRSTTEQLQALAQQNQKLQEVRTEAAAEAVALTVVALRAQCDRSWSQRY